MLQTLMASLPARGTRPNTQEMQKCRHAIASASDRESDGEERIDTGEAVDGDEAAASLPIFTPPERESYKRHALCR